MIAEGVRVTAVVPIIAAAVVVVTSLNFAFIKLSSGAVVSEVADV